MQSYLDYLEGAYLVRLLRPFEANLKKRRVLPPVLARCPRVLVATHVPPFRAATWHLGKPSDDNAAPHFRNHILGELAAAHPQRELLVLCGHTHSPGEVAILPNLTVWTGAATYGHPRLARVIDV